MNRVPTSRFKPGSWKNAMYQLCAIWRGVRSWRRNTAGGGTASVFEETESGRIQVWIQDEGKGIDLAHLPRATLETGYGTGSGGIGHGFYLMLSMADRLYLLTGPRGTTMVLEKDRISEEPAWLQSSGDAAA